VSPFPIQRIGGIRRLPGGSQHRKKSRFRLQTAEHSCKMGLADAFSAEEYELAKKVGHAHRPCRVRIRGTCWQTDCIHCDTRGLSATPC